MFKSFLALILCVVGTLLQGQDRPNVIWLISDDLGPELGCYGYGEVSTPNIDRLAQGGRRYTQAFSTSPVCSASRTAFQTGRYQTSIGGHHHNTRDKKALPASIPTITGLMRKAGYFVSNGRGLLNDKRKAKSHLNFVYSDKTFFSGTDWSQRNPGQPFFAQVQITEPHRKFKRSNRSRPKAILPPYYPEHRVIRADWANYLASIEELDRKVGLILKRLEDEGELDKTLIFFFGDHGRPHVRCKQWLYDGGIHTPFIVHWPEKIKSGEVEKKLVSLLDLMPTTLAACGVQGPKDLPGLNLFSKTWKGHPYIISARDRCGDAQDRIRSVRTEKFKYIKNFSPNRPYLQHSGYKKLQYPALTVMRVLLQQGNWDSLFMAKTRPEEELYDLKSDPHEMKNLASDPKFKNKLEELRKTLKVWVLETGDRGEMDENKTVDLKKVMVEKKKYYERTMKRRGLNPNLSDADYLKWWEGELGIK